MRIYIAGPMRGYPRYNFNAFDEAAARIRQHGHDVFNAAEMDRWVGFDPDTDEATPEFMRMAMARDMVAITDSDAVAVLPGWRESTGAKLEVGLAEMLGIPILDSVTLKSYCDNEVPL